ncbi:MAG TPA: tail fiber domain-containing protein [Phycisphaerae bacterium]|nr:tail fiber domain-containing protein [Phycisphaerae bacterium]
MKPILCTFAVVAVALTLAPPPARGQSPVGTAFTYQGQLKQSGSPANGSFTMAFSLWTDPTAGSQVGPTLTFDGTGGNPPQVSMTNGLFTVSLDFSVSPYTANQALWLEIAVGATTLTPRQPLTPAPFALNTRGVNVDANGDVGIGTSSPEGGLSVTTFKQNLSPTQPGVHLGRECCGYPSSTAIEIVADVGGGPVIDFNTLPSTSDFGARLAYDSVLGDLYLYGANLVCTANVGIGNVAPQEKLHISEGNVRIDDGELQSWGPITFHPDVDQTGDAVVRFVGSAGNETMRVDATGNVGIGTASPANNLSVSGNANFTGNVGIGTTSPAAALDVVGQIRTNSLGTTDTQPLTLMVNNHQAMQYQYAENTSQGYRGINTVGGSEINNIAAGVVGGTIAGGGKDNFSGTDSANTIATSCDFATIGGGLANNVRSNGFAATIAGGYVNSIGPAGVAYYATIGGGYGNYATAQASTVVGGQVNQATGTRATVAGGSQNLAHGDSSFAAGTNAQANHDGSFVWQDFNLSTPFASTGANQFLIQARGGVGINTNAPGTFALAVNGTAANSTGSWSVFSDARLKRDITAMKTGTLDRLLSLHGVEYEYTPQAVCERNLLPGRTVGFLAQEVEQVFPEWVGKDDQGYRYVTERGTTALVVEALRDLRLEKDSQLKQKDKQIAELTSRLEKIEKALSAQAQSK